jgi:hypothetical protein
VWQADPSPLHPHHGEHSSLLPLMVVCWGADCSDAGTGSRGETRSLRLWPQGQFGQGSKDPTAVPTGVVSMWPGVSYPALLAWGHWNQGSIQFSPSSLGPSVPESYVCLPGAGSLLQAHPEQVGGGGVGQSQFEHPPGLPGTAEPGEGPQVDLGVGAAWALAWLHSSSLFHSPTNSLYPSLAHSFAHQTFPEPLVCRVWKQRWALSSDQHPPPGEKKCELPGRGVKGWGGQPVELGNTLGQRGRGDGACACSYQSLGSSCRTGLSLIGELRQGWESSLGLW